MERDDVMQTTSKCGQHTYRTVHYFQKYAKKCIEHGIPAPFAAEMTKNAMQLLKDTGLEEKKKLCRCFRCNLDLTSTKTVSFRLSVHKRKMKQSKCKVNKKSVQLIAICKGCGAEMKGGALATEACEKRSIETSFDHSSRREPRRFSGQSAFSSPGISFQGSPVFTQVDKKISSSGRRRKPASKLQRILISQTPIRKETSLQDFLEAFKINT